MLNLLTKLAINSTLLTFLLLITGINGFFVKPANAHEDCYKQSLLFGGWTWICKPHFHTGEENHSCIAVFNPVKKYNFHIENTTNFDISFTLFNANYTINPNSYRYFYALIGGSDGCGDGGYSRPEITFDYIADDNQYTQQNYDLQVESYSHFFFQNSGNYVDLYHNSNSLPDLVEE